MDRLTSLEVFARVVELGGFSAAARKLNMSTTMVANHIKALESSLGVLLLQRTTRKVSPTEAGRFYFERSGAVLSNLQEINEAVGALTSTPRGRLRVYANNSIVPFLAPIVSEFMETHPQLTIELETGERMIDMIEEGFDLAIRMTLPEANLIARKLTTWRHMLVCSPQYAARHGVPEKPDDLVEHNCIQYAHYAYGDLWHFIDAAGTAKDVRINGSIVSNNAEMLREMAVRGRGIFLAPSPLVVEDIKDGKLVHVMNSYRGSEFAVSAVFPNRNHLPSKVRLFIDLLVERFAQYQQFAS